MDKGRLVAVGVAVNALLFGLKMWAGLLTHSTAVLSDALNSGLDLAVAAVVQFTIRLHEREADDTHHYGHRRAEPLAGLLVAAVAVVLGVSIVKDGIVGLSEHHVVHVLPLARYVLYGAMAAKAVLIVLYSAAYRRTGSTVMQATAVDARNDVLATTVALLGYGRGDRWDDMAGLAIGVWIIWSGLQTAWPNIHLLMGAAPRRAVLDRLAHVAAAVPGVVGLHDLRAHYVGDRLHVELHIEVDPKLTLMAAHAIGETVRERLEQVPGVQRAFIQVDPAGEA